MKMNSYLKIIVFALIYLIISLPIVFAEEQNLQYDSVGNLVTGDGFYREYDGFNHLIRIKQGNLSNGNISEEFIWHPMEERVFIKKIYWNNQTLRTTIKYLNKNTIKIKNESGTFYENYIYQDDILVAQRDANGNKQAVHNDHLGSISLITDSTGAVIENSFFSPFGEQIVPVSSSRFSFTGKEFDTTNSEYDLLSRRMKPEWTNRATTPDRIFYDFTQYEKERTISYYDTQLLNPYVYARNNPYKYTDSDGNFIQLAPILAGVLVIFSIYLVTQFSAAIANADREIAYLEGDPSQIEYAEDKFRNTIIKGSSGLVLPEKYKQVYELISTGDSILEVLFESPIRKYENRQRLLLRNDLIYGGLSLYQKSGNEISNRKSSQYKTRYIKDYFGFQDFIRRWLEKNPEKEKELKEKTPKGSSGGGQLLKEHCFVNKDPNGCRYV